MPQVTRLKCKQMLMRWLVFRGSDECKKEREKKMKVCTERSACLTAAACDPAFYPLPLSACANTAHSFPKLRRSCVLVLCVEPFHCSQRTGHPPSRKSLYSPSHTHGRHCQSIPIHFSDPLEPQPLIPSRHSNLGSRYQSTEIGIRDKNGVPPSIYLLLIGLGKKCRGQLFSRSQTCP